MRLILLSSLSLVALVLAFLIASCGEQPSSIPASGATPKSTLTVFAIPATFETKTPPVTATPTAAPTLTATPALTVTPTITASSATQPTTPTDPTSPALVSHGGPVQDYVSLIDNLRKEGAAVNPGDKVSQPFFTVEGNVISVNGKDVQTFEFADTATATGSAAQISADGSAIGTSMVSWIEPPHFFKKERLIVLYVGNDAGTINLLSKVLGPQVAGR